MAPFLYRGTTSAALQSSGTTPSLSDFLNIIQNGKLISSDNAFSILVCIPSIPAALFSFKFLNFFSIMGGSISVSVSLEPFLSSNCFLGFDIDSIFSLVKTELKELFRIFALLLSSKLSSPSLFTNGANLALVLDFVLIYAKNDLESLFMFSANFLSNFYFDLLASFV